MAKAKGDAPLRCGESPLWGEVHPAGGEAGSGESLIGIPWTMKSYEVRTAPQVVRRTFPTPPTAVKEGGVDGAVDWFEG